MVCRGDFNSISIKEDRVSLIKRSYKKEIDLFKSFMVNMDLIDLPTVGGKFTWFNRNEKVMSRLDRFLLSENYIEKWNVAAQFIGARDISDHAPIWINENLKNWGPKPFKFNNNWLKHDEFQSFVEEEWRKIIVKARGDFVLVEKLKILKGRLLK